MLDASLNAVHPGTADAAAASASGAADAAAALASPLTTLADLSLLDNFFPMALGMKQVHSAEADRLC